MRPNRKADLQRKLTLVSIPKPPVGLAERIKTDIPKHLPTSTEADRRRLSSAVAFNMRVAASVLLLIGSLFFALHLLNTAYREQDATMAEFDRSLKTNAPPSPAVSPLPRRNAPQVVTSTAQPPAQVAPPKMRAKQATEQVAQLKDEGTTRDYKEKKDQAANGVSSLGYLDKTRQNAAPAAVPAPTAVANAAPEPQLVPAAPTPAGPPPPAAADAAAARKAVSAPASVPYDFDSMEEIRTEKVAPGGLATVFGYVTSGKRLDAPVSLVQHFSAPETRPRHGVQVEADAAPAPFDAATHVLRVSIDTARTHLQGGSPAPVAADARLEIDFNTDAVASYRVVTGELAPSESRLVEGTSVTALYDMELKPSLARRTRLATVRLHYRSLPDGRERMIEHVLHVRDLAGTWDAAPLRTKRATLAAAFGETRARGADTSPIAEKARAIGLDELVKLAIGQSRIR